MFAECHAVLHAVVGARVDSLGQVAEGSKTVDVCRVKHVYSVVD
jgi:hypothetical protein